MQHRIATLACLVHLIRSQFNTTTLVILFLVHALAEQRMLRVEAAVLIVALDIVLVVLRLLMVELLYLQVVLEQLFFHLR